MNAPVTVPERSGDGAWVPLRMQRDALACGAYELFLGGAAGPVLSDSDLITRPGNLAPNPSFELGGAQPDGWAGGTVLAQDEATSVVWGMPGAVVRSGLADEVLPLNRVAQRICQLAGAPSVFATAAGVSS